MANVVNKIFVDKMGGRTAAQYIGIQGDLFYDPTDGALRISDGVTPGGTPLNTPTTAVAYRGYYAAYGSFYGDDPSVNQIFISKNQGMRVVYDTADTDNDDLHATGLSGSNIFIALNLYGRRNDKGLTPAVVSRFVKAFIDAVCYSGGQNEVGNILDVKNNFYSNIDNLVANYLPADALYQNFEFFSNQNWYDLVNLGTAQGGTSPASIAIYADSQNNNQYVIDGINNAGAGYEQGAVITIPAVVFGLESPDNDATFTIDSVGPLGEITGISVSGTGITGHWMDHIDDGGDDQYDSGNYLNTNAATTISYNNGIPVLASTAFGGGDYIVMYQNSVFAMFTGGCNITDFYYSGNMGADGNGDKVESALFGHESTQNTEYLDNQNNLIIADNSDNSITVTNGESHQIPNFSGMVLINDHYDGGVECWLCGAGNTVLLNSTRPDNVGTMQPDYSVNGYSWTNASNLSGPFTFTVIKTRPGA